MTKKSLQKNIENTNGEIADYEEELQNIYEDQAKEEKSVTASIDGEITEMTIKVGDEVNANTTIASIVDYTLLEFVTSVDELDISAVKVGQAAAITLSSITDKTIAATVSEIEREGTSSNGSSAFKVNIQLNDIEGVMAGMSGEAAITIEAKENIVLVPVNAVVEMGTRSFVRIPSENNDGTTEAGAAQQPAEGSTAGGRQQGAAAGQQGGAVGGGQGAAAGQGSAAGGTRPSGGGRGSAAVGQSAAEGGQSQAGAGQSAEGNGTAAGGGFAAAGGSGGSRMPNALGGQLVEVTTGLSDESFVEIVSGLSEGDSVLVPIAQGAAGMGSAAEATTMQQGGFGGGGMGGFPSGMGMGGGGAGMGGGGGGMR